MTEQELLGILSKSRIDTSNWGFGSAKSIDDLLKEIQKKEAELIINEGGLCVRNLKVVAIDVFYNDHKGNKYILVEEKQEFSDGRIRKRNLETSLGEKLYLNEEPNQGVIRCIREELSIESLNYTLENNGVTTKEENSKSYPGLKTVYVFFRFILVLNDNGYKPDGYIENDSKKTSYFVWKKIQG